MSLIKALYNGMHAAHVSQGNTHSKDFGVTNGMKQGCVFAPTLFSLYLSATLEVASAGTKESVYIQTRHEADLFNVAHFKAKTKIAQMTVSEMLFANDSTLVPHDVQSIQTLVNRFSKGTKRFSLKIEIKKAESLHQPIKSTTTISIHTEIKVRNKSLIQGKNFVYLGRTMSETARLDSKLTLRIGKASTAYGKLKDRLWNNWHECQSESNAKFILPFY